MYKTIDVEKLTQAVGLQIIIDISKQLDSISRFIGKVLNIEIIETDEEFEIKDNSILILSINKNNKNIRPFLFLRLQSLKIFDDYSYYNPNKLFIDTKFYNDLIKFQILHEDFYLYYYTIFLFDYFNLDEEEIHLKFLENKKVILEGIKYEFVYIDFEKRYFKYQKVLHIIKARNDSDEIVVTKVYSEQKMQTLNLKINDLI